MLSRQTEHIRLSYGTTDRSQPPVSNRSLWLFFKSFCQGFPVVKDIYNLQILILFKLQLDCSIKSWFARTTQAWWPMETLIHDELIIWPKQDKTKHSRGHIYIYIYMSYFCHLQHIRTVYSWWRHHLEAFPRYWSFMRGIHRTPVNSPHKGQWRGALIFSLVCAWTDSWANNGDAGDLRSQCAHYDVTVMIWALTYGCSVAWFDFVNVIRY